MFLIDVSSNIHLFIAGRKAAGVAATQGLILMVFAL